MPTSAELVAWARDHAKLLELDMRPEQGMYGGHYWAAVDLNAESRIRARAIQALDFLDRFAGPDSQWNLRGHELLDKGSGRTMETSARALGDVLRAWADQVDFGIIPVRQAEAQGVRVIASTDLMEQVRKLVEDNHVVPAAPIVLAGAALEVGLRSANEELGLPTLSKPSISGYAGSLRKAGLLSPQDVKDVEQMGGLRNSAAHGKFEELSRERAGLMEQQVNMFLRRLGELLDARTPGIDST